MRIKRQFDTFSLRSPSEDLLVRGEEGFVLPTGIVPGDSGDDTGDNGDGGGLLTNLLPVLFPLPPALPQVSTTTVQAVATATTTVVTQTTSHTIVSSSLQTSSLESTSLQFPTASQPAKANTATAVSTSPPLPSHSDSHRDSMDNDQSMGISKTTEHLLIAAGSIAATLAVVFIVFLVYRIRRGYKLTNLFCSEKSRRSSSEPYQSPRRGNSWNSFQFFSGDTKAATEQYTSRPNTHTRLPTTPRKALVRTATGGSTRPLISAMQMPDQSPSPQRLGPLPERLPGDSSQAQISPQISSRRPPSVQPSSPILPIERTSREFFEESHLSHPSMPTFLREAELNSWPQKVSRFSWTNSQAPKTPNDSRFSIATSTSSVPRYRTVESWVGAQTGRIDPAKFQDHLRREYEASRREPTPEVPAIPPRSPGRRSKLVKHQPHMSDASVFRVHPGTRIDIPRTSLIPSEILDARIQPHAL